MEIFGVIVSGAVLFIWMYSIGYWDAAWIYSFWGFFVCAYVYALGKDAGVKEITDSNKFTILKKDFNQQMFNSEVPKKSRKNKK